MKKKILEVLLGSLKAKIITGIVATLIVGGVIAGVIIQRNSSGMNEISLTDNKVSTNTESEEEIETNNDKETVTSSTDNPETTVNSDISNKEEDSNNKESTKPSNVDNSNSGGSTTPSNVDNSNNGGSTTPSNVDNSNNSNNGGSTTPSNGGNSNNSNNGGSTTPSKPTNPEPPKQEPTPIRKSEIDEELTRKLNKDNTIYYYERNMTNPKTDLLIKAARSLAFGGSVPEELKKAWKPYGETGPEFSYKKHAINIVNGETEYYYTREAMIDGMNQGFVYVIAYWDANINNYKLYYVTIMLC